MPVGTRHPLSIVSNDDISIFGRLGFTVAEGPEIEDDWHVFSALNFAADHPARDMQDTFFINREPDVLLRTHTSLGAEPRDGTYPTPIRIIAPDVFTAMRRFRPEPTASSIRWRPCMLIPMCRLPTLS